MPSYLLAWNPKRWQWDDLAQIIDSVKAGEETIDTWSCGTSSRVKRGDRVFLIRLGETPKGIFASGVVTEGSYEDTHWDKTKAEAGEKTHFVEVRFDTLLNPDTDRILPRKLLNDSPFSKMHWDTQMSGVRIPDEVAVELEKLWARYSDSSNTWLPEEVADDEAIYEGAVRQISVNAYERNPEARRKCIAHYGTSCSVCDFDFGKVYGKAGREFIHVHHLRQLSEVGGEYQIDPIKDLRPVCPNCHAIIHRRKPAYTLNEVKKLIREAKQ
jgi:5-methylcytosine-specific restriction protein A